MEIEEVGLEVEEDLLHSLMVPPRLTSGPTAFPDFALRKRRILDRLIAGLISLCDQVVSAEDPGMLLTTGFEVARGLGPSDRILFVCRHVHVYLFWTEPAVSGLQSLRKQTVAECVELGRDIKVAEAVEYVHDS